MRIEIKSTELILTPSLKEYIEKKFQPLSRFLKRYERAGEHVLFVEIARTTKHHKKGPVFYGEVTLSIEKKVFRAEVQSNDVRVVVDQLKDILREEIVQYKEKTSVQKRK